MKQQLENELIDNTKQEVERKHMIKDVDSAISDLNLWRLERQRINNLRKLEKETESQQINNQVILEDDDEDPIMALAQRQYEESMAKFNAMKLGNKTDQSKAAKSKVINDEIKEKLLAKEK